LQIRAKFLCCDQNLAWRHSGNQGAARLPGRTRIEIQTQLIQQLNNCATRASLDGISNDEPKSMREAQHVAGLAPQRRLMIYKDRCSKPVPNLPGLSFRQEPQSFEIWIAVTIAGGNSGGVSDCWNIVHNPSIHQIKMSAEHYHELQPLSKG